MPMQGHSDRIVRWEPTGAEQAVEIQEAWIKKKNWMWWSAAWARRLLPHPPPPIYLASSHNQSSDTHENFFLYAMTIHAPNSPLPQPASPPHPDPVIPSPPLHCLPSHYSLTAYPLLPFSSASTCSLSSFQRVGSLCWCQGRQGGGE